MWIFLLYSYHTQFTNDSMYSINKVGHFSFSINGVITYVDDISHTIVLWQPSTSVRNYNCGVFRA